MDAMERGSYRYGGRWSAPGTRIAYTAEHLSLAMIEYMVHLDPNCPPKDLLLVRARVPEDLPKLKFRADELPRGWQDYPAPESWLSSGTGSFAMGRLRS
jgi:RES domain-containing protein